METGDLCTGAGGYGAVECLVKPIDADELLGPSNGRSPAIERRDVGQARYDEARYGNVAQHRVSRDWGRMYVGVDLSVRVEKCYSWEEWLRST